MHPPGQNPKQVTRQTIDANLRAAGWLIQDRADANLHAARGIAIREFRLEHGHGFADYLLFVDGRAVGVLEAKKAGEPLRAHEVFAVHQPESLAEALTADTLHHWVQSTGAHTTADDTKPSTLRARVRTVPDLHHGAPYPNQVRAITNLEQLFRENWPRPLLQMATGSGKTLTAISSIYRLIREDAGVVARR